MNFTNFLTENQLTVIENDAPSSMRSFIHVFTTVLQVTENQLLSEIESFFIGVEYKNVLELEYGPHSRLIGPFESFIQQDFCPVLAMVCAVSWNYNCKVIIVNDYKNLSFLTRGEYFCLVKPLINERETIFVALTDMAHFKAVTVTDADQVRSIEDSIGHEATIHLSTLDSTPDEHPNESNDPNFSSESESESVIAEDQLIQENNSKTMQQYMAMNFFNQRAAGLVDPYCNECKIDVINSDFRMQTHSSTVTFKKSLDLDGVFALVDPDDFCNVVVSGGKIKKPVFCNAPKTLSSLKKHLFDVGIDEKQEISVIEFGNLHGGDDFKLFAVASWNRELRIDPASIELDKVLIKAHNAAKRFPCIDHNCPFRDEHLGLSSRPDDVTQIEVADFSWVYPPASFKCVTRDLAAFMLEEINSDNGVNLYFYVMLIGSKFTHMAQDVNSFGHLLDKVSEIINLKHLAMSQPPRAFLDVCWKYTTEENEVTIIKSVLVFIYFLF